MSGTTTNSSSVIVPLIEQEPGVWDITDLYRPDVAGSTGNILPFINSVVWEGNAPYKVTASDPKALTFTLEPAYLSADVADMIGSSISYGNDILRLYYDTRSTPYRVIPDERVIRYGGQAAFYTLTRYPKTAQAVVISQYYDSTGTYVSQNVPTQPLQDGVNAWVCPACNCTADLQADEEIGLTVYNETGAEIFYATLLAKASSIVNDAMLYQPRIVALDIKATQQLSNGDCYLYSKQSFDSLEIQGQLTFSDGKTQLVPVDQNVCLLFGSEDFVSSYIGLTQRMMLKYRFSPLQAGEVPASPNADTTITASSISRIFNVQVIPNTLTVPMKISVMPVWSNSLNAYTLQYFYYSTTRNVVMNITSYVTITSGTFVGTNYTTLQSFQISVDMSKIDPAGYSTETQYTQNVAIKLQAVSAYVRWVIQDAISSLISYGADGSSNRRPVMYYDTTLQQYFIPSTIFVNQAAFLQSFYYNASPPFNPNVEAEAPTPTHFVVRNITSGALLTASPIPLTSYTGAFTLVGGSSGLFNGSTVIVEFHSIDASGNDQIIYGAPVDVYSGTYQT